MNICSTRNLLDFNDITVDKQGRALVAYADGCTDACVMDATKPSTSRADFVMRQTTGMGLYAANDGQIGQPGGGAGGGPSSVMPEAPFPALLVVAAMAGGAYVFRRRRRTARG